MRPKSPSEPSGSAADPANEAQMPCLWLMQGVNTHDPTPGKLHARLQLTQRAWLIPMHLLLHLHLSENYISGSRACELTNALCISCRLC